MKTPNKTFSMTVELEIAKQIVGTSIRLWQMSVRTLWKEWPPSELKEETVHEVRARDVRALATLGSPAPTNQKSRMMVIKMD
jgi:hypothetical protein